jgi:hypothetical protein
LKNLFELQKTLQRLGSRLMKMASSNAAHQRTQHSSAPSSDRGAAHENGRNDVKLEANGLARLTASDTRLDNTRGACGVTLQCLCEQAISRYANARERGRFSAAATRVM